MKILNNTICAALMITSSAGWGAQETTTLKNKPTVPLATQQKAVQLNDAQILGIFHAINQGDIQAGKLAQKKAKETERSVQQTAQQSEKDHEEFERALQNIEKMNKLSPQESELQKSWTQEHNQAMAQLEKLEGKKFAQEYLRRKLEYHTKAMDVFSNQLIPNAKNPQLKAMLEKGMTTMKMHYQQAGLDMNLLNGPEQKEPSKNK